MTRYSVVANPDNVYGNRPNAIFDNVRKCIIEDCRSMQEAYDRIAFIEWEDTLPVGLRSNWLLSNVRSVRSKAETSIADFKGSFNSKTLTAEEQQQMSDLEEVVRILDKWKRTGKTPKYTGRV